MSDTVESWESESARTSCFAWDKIADRMMSDWESVYGGMVKAEKLVGFARPFGPNRKAGSGCESGKRDYCTCDSCF